MRVNKLSSKFFGVFAFALVAMNGCSSKSADTEEPIAAEASEEGGEDASEAAVAPSLGEDATDQDIGTLDNGTSPEVAASDSETAAPFPEPEAMPVAEDAKTSSIPEPIMDTAAPAVDDVPVASTPAVTAEGDLEYVVMPGDTLGKIAKRLYGSSKSYKKLASQNGLDNPNKIFPGDRLKYSSDVAVKKYKNGSGQVAKTAKIKRGETLGKLAKRLYGESNYWRLIWKYNSETIANPNRVSVGQSVSYIVLPKAKANKAVTH